MVPGESCCFRETTFGIVQPYEGELAMSATSTWTDWKERMARGDDEFVQFARLSSARLIHAAFLLTGDRDEAEDLAQTTLVRTYAAWSRVRRQGAHAYARATLVNLVTDRWRRPIREYPTELIPERSARTDMADEVSDRRWLVHLLLALAPQERAVIVLRHYFDLSEAETARELNISVGTIKSTNARALGKLRISAETSTDHGAMVFGGEQ